MIRVKKIEISDFRGIRNLTINFDNKNFAICGRNGTGKSGVVDALEFALTGNISRLSGSGTGGISIQKHAPHVDSRNNPEKARVVLTVFIPTLNKDATIERSVKDSSCPIITPNNPEVIKIINEVATHPEFTLSRRELIKYVISAPGDRAKEIQALLRLDEVENLRTVLQKIMNSEKKDAAQLKKDKDIAQQSLLTALEITDLNGEKLLKAVNIQRSIIGLSDILSLASATSIKDGLASAAVSSSIMHFPKVQAIADMKKLNDEITKIFSQAIADDISEVKKKIIELAKDPVVNEGVAREQFLRTAISLITDENCPVCDTPWESEELKSIIENKLKKFDTIAESRKNIEQELEPLIYILDEFTSLLETVFNYGVKLKISTSQTEFNSYILKLKADSKKLKSLLPLEDSINVLNDYSTIPDGVTEYIAATQDGINAVPDATKQDAAREYLTVGQERLEFYRGISLRHKQAEEKYKLATNIFDIYAKISTEALDNIYKEVQKDFTDLYRFINNEDEHGFTAELTPSIGKLSFDVDFYGRGYFPPGAYHSEGHQDGMGLCLYLALMKHLLGDSFTFAVLDDVLMSVDTGHRREVCKLLKDKFPNTQFILTTHDEVWLKHMNTAGLVLSKSSMFFRNWDVDHGPSEWNDRDIWVEIEDELSKNNVPNAAGLLRRYLEFLSREVCHQLRAKVEFHGDGHFDLGDLLPQAMSKFKKLLADGESAATSWTKTAEAEAIKTRKDDFSVLLGNSNIEQWQINKAVHYNEWVNLEASDFRPVVESYHELIKSLFCPNCNSIFYVTPPKGSFEALRCSCGELNINLNKK